MQYYKQKVDTYFNNIREDLISLMPINSKQCVLEIGAGGGDTLVAIKERSLAQEVYGIDLFILEKTNQTHKAIDKFIILDIEKENLPFEINYFDTIICGDVLEHLVDPWLVIKKITSYIKPGGSLIVSVPNIRNYKALFKIVLKGKFEYDPAGGILDKTHLRFFCRQNLIEMMATNELKLETIVPINYHPKYKFGAKTRLLNVLTFKLFEEFFVHQYLAVSKRII